MIQSLDNKAEFRRRREEAWLRNIEYWLAGELRHVVDTGAYILNRVEALCLRSGRPRPTLLDMGFGSAWLLQGLLDKNVNIKYLGVDALEPFVSSACHKFRGIDATFVLADLERDLDLGCEVDVVVNAFNFFELCDLQKAMKTAARHLRCGGRLFMSTIDKTYLILALSNGWGEFRENLRRYQDLPGIKYGFQKVDLGAGLSTALEYPSVLYSLQDYLDAAGASDLALSHYEEQSFTSRPIPKIYCHLEFLKTE